jgi:YggT family protein
MGAIIMILDAYSLVILAAVILSWIQLAPDNPILKVVNALTEPLLGPLRRALPDMGGLDISPMIVLLGLRLIRSALLKQMSY